MFDAHILAWKKHLEREEIKVLLAAKFRVTDDWRRKWAIVQASVEASKGRKWLT